MYYPTLTNSHTRREIATALRETRALIQHYQAQERLAQCGLDRLHGRRMADYFRAHLAGERSMLRLLLGKAGAILEPQ